ncbi:hypothetical protein EV201_2753 [Ancylomarina subtilis]|uniref:Uncharacterized protein n=1 Tax=Ancylomarina subtilis TaxID=1639035 RepID=A0A4Q7VD19_9BACT|nr:hypothetical protein [Ancylomarina subtilis]RZT93580.1 hypothetical protein EV201_2753 [Ancylomarina subtilis]
MNNLIETILINSSITTVLGTVCFFFIKAWYNKKASKDLEIHKGDIRKEIETQLESHKGDIQKDLENLKDSYIKENLESTRFVEVICRQRIVWSDQLRDDITEIVSKTQLFVEISEKHLQSFGIEAFAKTIEMFQEEKFSANEAGNVINSSIDNAKSSLPIKIEVIGAITRLKLKLNPIQDYSVILLLESIRNLIENPTDNSQPPAGARLYLVPCEAENQPNSTLLVPLPHPFCFFFK